jgi:hypothetical protein
MFRDTKRQINKILQEVMAASFHDADINFSSLLLRKN